MSKRNHGRVNGFQSSFGRRRQAKRSHVICEALEQRRLLSGYTGQTFNLAAQSGTNQAAINLANGTYLQALINGTTTITGHTITLGDTLVLPAGADYDMGADTTLNLPNLGAAASVQYSGGAITGLSLTFAPAGGYSAQPTVVIFGGGGSGATGTLTYNSTTGTVTGIALGLPGTGYTSQPQVAIVGGAETLTIESSSLSSLGSGRFNPATDESYVAQISGGFINGVVTTVLSDSHGHSGAAQNYTFDGIEVAFDSATDYGQAGLVNIGLGTAAQNYDQLVANNFTFNQDYIHGGYIGETSDDLATAALETSIVKGLALNANYVTVENSQISDIHSASNNGGGDETHDIDGYNLMGNFTINNNYLEATGCNIIFGGAENYLPDPAQANNLTITNNYFTKNPAWNPTLPQYAGVPMVVKNELELKTGTNATISHNLFENVWVGADQRGEALNIDNIDSHANGVDTWTDVEYVTVTDNVFRNVGIVMVLASGAGDTSYQGIGEDGGSTELTHDVAFNNNLAYDIGGFQWANDGGSADDAIWLLSQAGGPMQNVTIENNTIIGTDGIIYMAGPTGLTHPVVSNFVCENNVLDESAYGIVSGAGTDNGTLNSVEFSALTITNPGSGYTSAPTVTITGGGATGTNQATATAYAWPSTGFGGYALPLAGQIMYIQLNRDYVGSTHYGGSGYTSQPTITITGGGGSGATASAVLPANDTVGSVENGALYGYNFTNNVIIGGSSSNYPSGNYFPTTEDATEFLDVAGDEYGLLSTSAFYQSGTMGVNIAALTSSGDSTPWNPADVNNSLQNYYKFDEDTGTIANDNGLGTHENATLSSSGLWTTSGEMNSGIALSGSGYVKVPNFTADASFTFAAWINPNTVSANSYIASTANNAFSLYINSNKQLVAAGTTGTIPGSASTVLPTSAWSLVSATFSSGTLTLYVNGAEVGSTSATTTSGTTTLYIGASSSAGSSFSGTIDEVRYYNASLAQTMSVVGNTNLGLAGGVGYLSGTNGFSVTFSGGGGSNAAATAYAENSAGAITSIIMANNGSGYTSAPALSFAAGVSGTNGTGASDTAVMSVTPLSYLYAQYGPQFNAETSANGSDVVKGKSTTLDTIAFTPDEKYSAATYVWSSVASPEGFAPPSLSGANDAGVTFYGPGRYVFQCVATNSKGQSATLDYPLNVDAVGSTNVVFVSPASVTLAKEANKTFTVNGTPIASLNVTDQFGNPMPSSGWSWFVPTPASVNGSITSGGVYTAPDNVGDLGAVVFLNYVTPDGVTYRESTASVDVSSQSAPGQPQNLTVAPSGTNNVLVWTALSGTNATQTGYEVWTSPDTNQADFSLDPNAPTLGASATTWTDTSESIGSTWYYEVTASNTNGTGAFSNMAGIVTGAPLAPSNLVATGGFNNSIGLTWTNTATNATGVEVERSTDDTNWTQVANLAGTATSWTDNATNDPGNPPFGAPVDGTPYYYYVTTSNSAATSLGSDTSSATPIGPPTGLTATAIASNQISVSWVDTSNGVANFNLQYENPNGGSWTAINGLAIGNTSYLLTTGLSADTQYNFEVEAYTSAGNSGWSAPVGARTWNTAGTPTVYEGFNYNPVGGGSTNLIGLNGGIGWSGGWAKIAGNGDEEIDNGSPSITPTAAFSGSTAASDYLLTAGNSLYSSNAGGGVRTLASAIPDNASTTVWASVVVENLTSGGEGFVELLGNNASGGTNNVEFGFPNDNFSITVPGVNNWGSTAPVEGDTYLLVLEIEYGASGANSTLKMYVDPDPTQPTSSWTPYVTATPGGSLNNIDSVEIWGSWSGLTTKAIWDELRISTNAASAVVPLMQPNAPTNLTATPSGTNIALAWTASNSGTNLASGYDVWRSANNDTSYGSTPYLTLGSSASSYTDTSVTAGTTYYYEVTAENTTGDSLNSNVVSLGAGETKPAAPSNLAAMPGTSSITLTWQNNATNQSSFTIQRSTDDATWSTTWTGVSSAATTFTDTTPSSGVTYYYQIEAVNAGGDSAFDQLPDGLAGGVATVYAYEGFNYPTASTWNGVGTTGVGFTGNWTVSSSGNASIVAGLTYSSGGNALTTTGNAVKLTGDDSASQTLTNSVGTAGSTLWVGFEFSANGSQAGVKIGSGTSTGYVELGSFNGGFGINGYTNTDVNFNTSTGTLTSGTTYFEVGEIEYATTSPVIILYVNPVPNSINGATPTGALYTITKTLPSTAGSLSATTALSLFTANNVATIGTLDEVRLGSTFASVAPDPIVTNASSNSGTPPKHRQSHTHRPSPFLAGVVTPKASNVIFSPKPAVAKPNRFYPGLDGGAWQWASAANDVDSVLLGTTSKNGLFN